MQVAFVNVPATQQQYDALYVGSDVEAELTLRRSQIYSRVKLNRARFYVPLHTK